MGRLDRRSLQESATVVGDDAYLDYPNGVRLWISAIDLLNDDVGSHRWTSTMRNGEPSYFIRSPYDELGKKTTILLHRAILGLKHGDKMNADHINGDKADNRRSNLRKANDRQNCMNASLKPGNNTGIPGVQQQRDKWGNLKNRWRAKIAVAANVNHVEYFSSFLEAVEWRLKMQRKYYKNFAPTGR